MAISEGIENRNVAWMVESMGLDIVTRVFMYLLLQTYVCKCNRPGKAVALFCGGGLQRRRRWVCRYVLVPLYKSSSLQLLDSIRKRRLETMLRLFSTHYSFYGSKPEQQISAAAPSIQCSSEFAMHAILNQLLLSLQICCCIIIVE